MKLVKSLTEEAALEVCLGCKHQKQPFKELPCSGCYISSFEAITRV